MTIISKLKGRRISFKVVLFVALTLLIPVLVLIAQAKGGFRLQSVTIQMAIDAPLSYSVYIEQTQKDLNKLLGQDLWSLDLSDLEKHLKNRSWVESVRVSRRFPDQLNVFVTGKPAVAILLDRKGLLRPLSISAEVLPPIRADQAPALPVIQDSRIERDLKLRERVAKMISELPVEGRLTAATIDQISFTKSGQILIHDRNNGSKIHLGEENIPLRSARVARVLDYLDHNQIVWKEINADFHKKVVVKKNTALSPDLHIAQ